MKNWKPWDHIYNDAFDMENMLGMLHLKPNNPFPAPTENFEAMRHDASPRVGSANLHPED